MNQHCPSEPLAPALSDGPGAAQHPSTPQPETVPKQELEQDLVQEQKARLEPATAEKPATAKKPGPANKPYPLVVLIGPSGAGKTTIGQALSAELECQFRDTDADVERTSGRTIGEIMVDDGEAAFRLLEQQAVQQALSEHRGVLALGGGAIINEHTRAALIGHCVVFLDVAVGPAIRRIGLDQSRPLLLGQPRALWAALMDKRRGQYLECMHLQVDTSARTPEQVVQHILQALPHLPRADHL